MSRIIESILNAATLPNFAFHFLKFKQNGVANYSPIKQLI